MVYVVWHLESVHLLVLWDAVVLLYRHHVVGLWPAPAEVFGHLHGQVAWAIVRRLYNTFVVVVLELGRDGEERVDAVGGREWVGLLRGLVVHVK